MIPSNWNTGNYSIGADYLGTSKYAISTNTSILTVDPSAYLYLQITSSNKNPKLVKQLLSLTNLETEDQTTQSTLK
jgi:hypothetical protein